MSIFTLAECVRSRFASIGSYPSVQHANTVALRTTKENTVIGFPSYTRGDKVVIMAKTTSAALKQAIRDEIMKAFGDGFELVKKASYFAIREKGSQDNAAAIFGGKGGQSIWFKTAAFDCIPLTMDPPSTDVSTLGRGYQHCQLISDEEDPNIGIVVGGVLASLE